MGDVGRVLIIGGQRGSALLLVVGATAAVSALTLALLSASLLAYEVAALEHQGTQARLLSGSALDLVAAELAAGRLRLPAGAEEVVWSPPLPPPPPGSSLPTGCGFQLRLTLVRGPLGAQTWEGATLPAVLIDAVAEARCGRGFNRRGARFARRADGSVVRLY